MGRENQMRDIDDLKVEVSMLPPKQALKVLTRLSKIIGEPLGFAAGVLFGGGEKKPVGAEVEETASEVPKSLFERQLPDGVLAKVMAAFTDRLEEDVVTDTVDVLMTCVQIQAPGDNGTRRVKLDVDFAGKTLLLLKVVAFAIEVNFSDFFGASGVSATGLLSRARAAVSST